MSGIKIKNLNEVKGLLREYMKHTKRTLPVVLDTKAYYICRGALYKTVKVPKSTIQAGLLAPGSKLTRYLTSSSRLAPNAPIGALIINRRRGSDGKRGLYGPAMRAELKRMIAFRTRSRAFIASGWLNAIMDLDPYAERKSSAPKRDPSVKQYGRPKGGAAPAGRHPESAFARTTIQNAASANKDLKGALQLYGMPAFVSAWNDEMVSIQKYISDHLKKDAEEAGFKVH